VGLFVLGGLQGIDTLKSMGLAWILGNGICAAIGSLIALARPQTILISFLAAPITSLNPTIGVGFVTGLLEYLFRKPKVEDLENLSADTGSLKGWYRNRVTRVLLVFFLSSLGSSIGTFWAGARIAMILPVNRGDLIFSVLYF
jgi:pheromone shutdown protein TraB